MECNTNELAFFEIGSGQPIVLLHGFLCSSEIWKSVANRLSSKFRVICPDLPGHGNSIQKSDSFSEKEFIDRFRLFFKLHAIKKPIIIGHSMGGYVAMELLNSGIEMSGFGLFNSNPLSDSPEKQQQRLKELRILSNSAMKDKLVHALIQSYANDLNEHQIKQLLQMAQLIETNTIAAYIRAMINRQDLSQIFKNLSIPVLVIQGELDKKQPIFELPITANFVTIPDSGHYSFIDHETTCINEIIRTFSTNDRIVTT